MYYTHMLCQLLHINKAKMQHLLTGKVSTAFGYVRQSDVLLHCKILMTYETERDQIK